MMKSKKKLKMPPGIAMVMMAFALVIVIIIFAFIIKDPDLHSGDSPVNVQSTAASTSQGDDIMKQTEMPGEAAPAPGYSRKISELAISSEADVIFLVIESGNGAECEFMAFTRNGGSWPMAFETSGFLGTNGVNYEQRREGDYTTPGGIFKMKECFGILSAPAGMSLDYTKVTSDHYWDGDRNSASYNTLVESSKMPAGWDKSAGEHLVDYLEQYRYCMNIGFNCNPAVPGVGFAIFLHCTGSTMDHTAGCVAIPKEYMVKCLEMATDNTYIIILKDSADLENIG